MVSSHMFVATQPRRPLDSFSGPTLSPYRSSPNSFPCHTSENSPVSPSIATLLKSPVSNPCVCHTSETPWVSSHFGHVTGPGLASAMDHGTPTVRRQSQPDSHLFHPVSTFNDRRSTSFSDPRFASRSKSARIQVETP